MPTSGLVRRCVLFAFALAVAIGPTFAEESVGSLELLKAKMQRVRSVLAGAREAATWWRYDAPEGKVFLVVLMDVKPTYAADPVTGGKNVRIPGESVYAEGPGWKAGAVGSLYPSGTFVPLHSAVLMQGFDGAPTTMFVDFVFVVPESAKQATIHTGDVRVEAKLSEPVLPGFDWRDAMDVTIVRAEKVDPPVRATGVYDDLANRDHEWQVRYGEAEQGLVAVTFRVQPKRGNPDGHLPNAFLLHLLDFRLAYGEQTHVRGICSISEPGYAEALESENTWFEREADGNLKAKEFTIVYPLHEPATNATLLYRDVAVEEFEIESDE